MLRFVPLCRISWCTPITIYCYGSLISSTVTDLADLRGTQNISFTISYEITKFDMPTRKFHETLFTVSNFTSIVTYFLFCRKNIHYQYEYALYLQSLKFRFYTSSPEESDLVKPKQHLVNTLQNSTFYFRRRSYNHNRLFLSVRTFAKQEIFRRKRQNKCYIYWKYPGGVITPKCLSRSHKLAFTVFTA